MQVSQISPAPEEDIVRTPIGGSERKDGSSWRGVWNDLPANRKPIVEFFPKPRSFGTHAFPAPTQSTYFQVQSLLSNIEQQDRP
jgi:hypothetical protein